MGHCREMVSKTLWEKQIGSLETHFEQKHFKKKERKKERKKKEQKKKEKRNFWKLFGTLLQSFWKNTWDKITVFSKLIGFPQMGSQLYLRKQWSHDNSTTTFHIHVT